MTYEEISSLVAAESDDLVYIADCDTYELLYLNRAILNLCGNPPLENWFHRPCYEVLHGRRQPCDFCSSRLTEQDFRVWERYDERVGRYFSLRGKLIRLDGRRARLEIAIDITEKENFARQLEQRLHAEETLISCIQTLAHTQDAEQAIGRLLAILGDYFQADRCYIYEITPPAHTFSNTYEWRRKGAAARAGDTGSLPDELAAHWLARFQQSDDVFLCRNDQSASDESRALLERLGLLSLMAAPLRQGTEIIGFLGMDNPAKRLDAAILLRSISSFVVDDITKRQMLEQLTHMSYTDSLTDLGNRHLYSETLKRLAALPPASLGVVFVDINGLKVANDTHGHQFGDFLIRHIAESLRGIFHDNVYRIGGDEFVVLCPDVDRAVFDGRVAELRARCAEDANLHVSIGVTWNACRVDVYRQISHTDELMYIDKQAYYSQCLDGLPHERSSLSHELLREIDEGRFLVQLQPKINLKSGELGGAEALVRRLDSDGRLVPPSNFISMYEAEGIIRHVDFYVLDSVCSLLRTWRDMGVPEVKIAVNLSRVTLMEHGVVDKLLAVCRQYDVAPLWIDIEVTGSISSMEPSELAKLVDELASVGFSVSLDDFGAEYSHLAILSSLDFGSIKLDRSLIEHLEDNPRSRIIARHTIQMCQDLDLTTSVAEGVENAAQCDVLQQLECEVGQGYFFDRPLNVQEFTEKYLSGGNT